MRTLNLTEKNRKTLKAFILERDYDLALYEIVELLGVDRIEAITLLRDAYKENYSRLYYEIKRNYPALYKELVQELCTKN